MCSTGSPEAFWMRSIRSRRSQPDWVAGCVETITSLGRCSAIASIVARNGSGSPTCAAGLDALVGEQRHGEVDAHLRRFAHRLVVDHEARGGLALGHHEAEARVASAPPARARARAACVRRACGWPLPGSPSSRSAFSQAADYPRPSLAARTGLCASATRRRCSHRHAAAGTARPRRAPAPARRYRAPRRARRTRTVRPRPWGRDRS